MINDRKGNSTRIHSLGKFEQPNTRVGSSLQMTIEYSDYYYEMDITVAIRDYTLDCELACSLLEEGVINHCNKCSVKFICYSIDKVA